MAAKDAGTNPVGLLGALGKIMFTSDNMTGALDFAGGTVVHIAAGFSSLAAILVLRKRIGYPDHPIHPNSMVLTLTGAGLLWFGWFGFNGGSGLMSGGLARVGICRDPSGCRGSRSELDGGGMGASWQTDGPWDWPRASWPAWSRSRLRPAMSYPWGGLAIGLIAGVVCYFSVTLKPFFKYDDSLDAFGVHGVGGFLGAVLTGVFCYTWNYLDPVVGADGVIATRSLGRHEAIGLPNRCRRAVGSGCLCLAA